MDLSVRDAGKLIGVSGAHYAGWKNGKPAGELNHETRRRIDEFLMSEKTAGGQDGLRRLATIMAAERLEEVARQLRKEVEREAAKLSRLSGEQSTDTQVPKKPKRGDAGQAK